MGEGHRKRDQRDRGGDAGAVTLIITLDFLLIGAGGKFQTEAKGMEQMRQKWPRLDQDWHRSLSSAPQRA